MNQLVTTPVAAGQTAEAARALRGCPPEECRFLLSLDICNL